MGIHGLDADDQVICLLALSSSKPAIFLSGCLLVGQPTGGGDQCARTVQEAFSQPVVFNCRGQVTDLIPGSRKSRFRLMGVTGDSLNLA